MKFGDYEIQVTERANCRRIVLHAKASEDYLTMSVPPRTTRREIMAFLERNRAWIEAHGKKHSDWVPQYAPGEVHCALGQRVVLGQNGIPSGKAFLQWRAEQLMQIVKALFPAWQARMGVQARNVRFRDMKSRWGSCQVVTHDITLNARLVMVPPECVEYVVVHELCHIIVPNHSPAFHDAMSRFMPDWKARRKLLNTFDTQPRPHA